MRFADIPIDWSDFRLTLRQTTDILRRFDALEPDDHRAIVDLGRDSGFEPLVKRWYEATSGVNGGNRTRRARATRPAGLDQVLVLALRPFLARCAEVLMQRTDLPAVDARPLSLLRMGAGFLGDHARTPSAVSICGRCLAQWAFDADQLPVLRATTTARASPRSPRATAATASTRATSAAAT